MKISNSILGIALGLALPGTALAAEPAPNLCDAKETVVLACKVMGNGKLASLCLGEGKLFSGAPLTYRFGKPDKVELVFPKEPAAAKKHFKREHSCWKDGCSDTVQFTNEGVLYVFDSTSSAQADSSIGVSIHKDGKSVAELRCDASSVFAIEKLDKALPVDK